MSTFTIAILIISTTFIEIECDEGVPPIPDPGAWYPHGRCPSGTFLKALRLKVAKRKGLTAGSGRMIVEIDPIGYGDETGLKSMEIFCSNTGKFNATTNIKSEYSLDDEYSYLTCPGDTYATDFQLFLTKQLNRSGDPVTNSWFLGPHQFADYSSSSLRLFCGKSYDWSTLFSNGPSEEFGPSYPDDSTSCRYNERYTDILEVPVLCGLGTSQRNWNRERDRLLDYTWKGSFLKKCCYLRNFICNKVSADGFHYAKIFDNRKGQTPLRCEFERRIGVSYDNTTYDDFDYVDDKSRFAQKDLDISSQKKLGIKLEIVGPYVENILGGQFSTSSMPETVSAAKNYGNIIYSVPAGVKSLVKQLRGRCGVYVMDTDIFTVINEGKFGQTIDKLENQWPL